MALMSRRYQMFAFTIVGRREHAARLRPAHDADDVDRAGAAPCAAGVLAVERHEAAVDDHEAAAGEPRRREHPVARPLHVGAEGGAGGIDQRLLAGQEFGGKADAAEFVALLVEPAPSRRAAADRAGACASRAVIAAIRFSFQTLRSSCQMPRPTRMATPTSAKIVGSKTPRALRALTRRLAARAGLPPPCGGIAARSAGP